MSRFSILRMKNTELPYELFEKCFGLYRRALEGAAFSEYADEVGTIIQSLPTITYKQQFVDAIYFALSLTGTVSDINMAWEKLKYYFASEHNPAVSYDKYWTAQYMAGDDGIKKAALELLSFRNLECVLGLFVYIGTESREMVLAAAGNVVDYSLYYYLVYYARMGNEKMIRILAEAESSNEFHTALTSVMLADHRLFCDVIIPAAREYIPPCYFDTNGNPLSVDELAEKIIKEKTRFLPIYETNDANISVVRLTRMLKDSLSYEAFDVVMDHLPDITEISIDDIESIMSLDEDSFYDSHMCEKIIDSVLKKFDKNIVKITPPYICYFSSIPIKSLEPFLRRNSSCKFIADYRLCFLVDTDTLKKMMKILKKYHIELSDKDKLFRQLAEQNDDERLRIIMQYDPNCSEYFDEAAETAVKLRADDVIGILYRKHNGRRKKGE